MVWGYSIFGSVGAAIGLGIPSSARGVGMILLLYVTTGFGLLAFFFFREWTERRRKRTHVAQESSVLWDREIDR